MPRIEVWTANFGRGVSAKKFRSSFNAMLEAADADRAVLLLQEIDEADAPDEHKIIANRIRSRYDAGGWMTAVPILLSRERFRIDSKRVTFGSKGFPGITPHRVVNEVVTTIKSLRYDNRGEPRVDFPQIAFLDTHFPLNRPETRTRRAVVRAVLTRRVAAHVAAGRIVVYGLDSNTHGPWLALVPGEKMLLPAGIDKLGIVAPKGVTVSVAGRKKVELGIDSHDAEGVVLDLGRRRR